MLLDNAFEFEVQANGDATNASAGGPGASFMPKLGGRLSAAVAADEEHADGGCRVQ